MKSTEDKNEFIQRYTHEVGRHLARKMRGDVTAELESLLEESLAEVEAHTGRSASMDDVSRILKDFGPPQLVAQRYTPKPRHLIGPQLYPFFLLTIKITSAVAAGLPGILLLVSYFTSPLGSVQIFSLGSLFNWLTLTYHIAFWSFGTAVIVFAILERAGVMVSLEDLEEWNPLSLPPIDDPNSVALVSVTIKTHAIVMLMILFNLFPESIGIYNIGQTRGFQITKLSDLGLEIPLLPLDFWWLCALGLNLWLLRDRRWTRAKRWLEFGLGVFAFTILGLFTLHIMDVVKTEVFLNSMPAPQVAGIVGKVLPIPFIAFTLMVIVDSCVRLYRLLRKPAPQP